MVEMAVAMSRHANTPRRFMHLAMRYAVRMLNRLHRKMPDGTVDVPLWRFKGSKVPLNLDRYHPFGCAAEAVLPKSQQRRFAPKTKRCVYFGYDDHALSYVLGVIPGYAILHTIHAYFNDDDFPCRASSASWDVHPSYDMAAEDPLGPWLGSVGALRLHEPDMREFPQAGMQGRDLGPGLEANIGRFGRCGIAGLPWSYVSIGCYSCRGITQCPWRACTEV